MKPSDFEYLKREVLPSEHVNVYLGMEYFMSTYFEMNFTESEQESIDPLKLEKIEFTTWFSWS